MSQEGVIGAISQIEVVIFPSQVLAQWVSIHQFKRTRTAKVEKPQSNRSRAATSTCCSSQVVGTARLVRPCTGVMCAVRRTGSAMRSLVLTACVVISAILLGRVCAWRYAGSYIRSLVVTSRAVVKSALLLRRVCALRCARIGVGHVRRRTVPGSCVYLRTSSPRICQSRRTHGIPEIVTTGRLMWMGRPIRTILGCSPWVVR